MKANSDYCDKGSECNSGVCYNHSCDVYVKERDIDKIVDGVITVVAVIIVVIAIILSCTKKRKIIAKKEPKVKKSPQIKKSKSQSHNSL